MRTPRFHIGTLILLVVILAQALALLAQGRIAARCAVVIDMLSLHERKYREEIIRIQKNCQAQQDKIATEFAAYKESHP